MGFQDLILPAAELAASISIASAISWLFYTRFYLPVPPNRALVLYGHRAASPHTEPGRRVVSSDPEVRHPHILVGGGVFVAPWNRGVGHLSLDLVDVDLTIRSMNVVDGGRASGWETRIRVQAKIPTDSALLVVAAENLLEKNEDDLRMVVRRAVEGAVPAVLARWRPEPGEPDWERLAAEIQASVAPDLVQLGMVVRNLFVVELHSIVPSDLTRSALPVPPTAVGPGLVDPPALSGRLAAQDSRMSRIERSLAILGAEVERQGRTTPASIFDIPLGLSGPDETLGSEIPAEQSYDSMGGDRSPRSRRPPEDGSVGEGAGEPRPLLDTEN